MQTPSPAMPNIAVALPPGSPSLDASVGAFTVSAWLSVFSFGVVCSATYIYYVSFPKDRLGVKLLVFAVWLVSAIDTIASCTWVYDWTVRLWGSIPGAGIIPYGFYTNIICDATATLINQCFYAWRVWIISDGSYVLCGLIIAAAITQQIVAVWALSVWGSHHALISEIGLVLPGAYGWLIASILGDTMISAVIFYYLRVKPHDTPKQSRTTFNRIISRTVQANVFSLVSQTTTFALYKLDVGMYFFLNDVVICKVYAFSLLTSLNARRSWSATPENSRSHSSTAPAVSIGISFKRHSAFSGANSSPVIEVPTDADWNSRVKVDQDWDANDRTSSQA